MNMKIWNFAENMHYLSRYYCVKWIEIRELLRIYEILILFPEISKFNPTPPTCPPETRIIRPFHH